MGLCQWITRQGAPDRVRSEVRNPEAGHGRAAHCDNPAVRQPGASAVRYAPRQRDGQVYTRTCACQALAEIVREIRRGRGLRQTMQGDCGRTWNTPSLSEKRKVSEQSGIGLTDHKEERRLPSCVSLRPPLRVGASPVYSPLEASRRLINPARDRASVTSLAHYEPLATCTADSAVTI